MIMLYVRDPYDVYITILHRQMYATIKKKMRKRSLNAWKYCKIEHSAGRS